MERFNAEGYPDPTAYKALTAIEREERAAKQYLPLVYIASPFGNRKKIKNLFSTHPPIEERIKALKQIA